MFHQNYFLPHQLYYAVPVLAGSLHSGRLVLVIDLPNRLRQFLASLHCQHTNRLYIRLRDSFKTMISIRRSTFADPDFRSLVAELDTDLQQRYGAKQSQYDVHNKALEGASVVIALNQDQPVGCGCFKAFDQADTVELKRMYVQPSARGVGIAQQIITELEQWASEKGYSKAVLQTAIKQPEAIAFYRKCGYQPMAAYGAYVGDEDSVCMEKQV